MPDGGDGLPLPARLPDTGVVVCRPTRWWLRYGRVAIGISVGGGAIMLIGAAAAHDTAAVPLLILGGAWLAVGLNAILQRRRQVQEIDINGDSVEFRSTVKCLTIPASEILGVKVNPPWWNPRLMGYVRFQTRSDGVIKVPPPQIQDLYGFLTELQHVNPYVMVQTP